MALRTLLFRPERYFETWQGRSLGRAAVVVGLVAFVGGVGALVAVAVTITRISSPPAGIWWTFLFGSPVKFVGTMLAFAVALLLVWALYGVELFVVARLAGGKGSVGDTFAVAGLALAPLIVQLSLLYTVFVATVSTTMIPGTASAMTAQLRALTGDGGMGVVSDVLAVGILAWQAVIWTYGLRAHHELGLRRAGLVAGVVAVVEVSLVYL